MFLNKIQYFLSCSRNSYIKSIFVWFFKSHDLQLVSCFDIQNIVVKDFCTCIVNNKRAHQQCHNKGSSIISIFFWRCFLYLNTPVVNVYTCMILYVKLHVTSILLSLPIPEYHIYKIIHILSFRLSKILTYHYN